MKRTRLTAEQLRKSILQLAIQGKLVKQNPNDETASELVKKIYAEKKKLIVEGKIKADKNESFIFKGDDNFYYEKIGKADPVKLDDLPFDIPNNWTWLKIKSVFNIVNGFTPLRSESKFWQDGDVNWFTVDDIRKQGKIISETMVKINHCACSTDRIVPPNSFLICCTASVGEFALTRIPLTTNQQFNSLYLKYYSLNCYLMEFILSIGGYFKNVLLSVAGKTTFPFISTKKLGEIYLPLPPLEEQERIVKRIELIESLLAEYDKYEQELDRLENEFKDKLKKSILQYAIKGKLVKQDPNDEPASVLLERIKAEKEKLIKEGKIKRDKNESYIYQGDNKNYYENLPKGWAIIRLANISKLITKGTTPMGGNASYLKKGIGFLRAENVNGYDELELSNLKYISSNVHYGYLKRSILEQNDILITIAGTLGRTGIVRKEFLPLNINQAVSIVRLIDSKEINLKYVIYVLNSPSIHKSLIEKKKITAIPNLTIEIIRDCELVVTPLNEQNRIVNKIDNLFCLLSD